MINRLVRDPESGRPAPIMPGTVSRRAVGPAGGLSWLQISGAIDANRDEIPVMVRKVVVVVVVVLSAPQGASKKPATQWGFDTLIMSDA